MAADLAGEAFEIYRDVLVPRRDLEEISELNEAIDLAVRLVQRHAPVVLALETEDDFEVGVGRSRLLRVLINLLNNASHALDELENPEGASITLSSWASEDFAFVQVADDGPGIPAAVRAEIFELFFTTHGEGSGIGLYVCKTLVDEWGGMIHVESREGEGARFTFSIPRARRPG
nr:ATP-binding protein [Pseudenhygromyxa sp. WMMC2535]